MKFETFILITGPTHLPITRRVHQGQVVHAHLDQGHRPKTEVGDENVIYVEVDPEETGIVKTTEELT